MFDIRDRRADATRIGGWPALRDIMAP